MSQNYAKNSSDQAFLLEALQWHLDNGADETLVDSPVDRTAMPEIPKKQPLKQLISTPSRVSDSLSTASSAAAQQGGASGFQDSGAVQGTIMGAAQAIVEAQKLAVECKTLDDLSRAIRSFEGLSIRKNATNMVFSDGNPKASIMLIGEAPGADEDIQGKPFVGASGQLLDRILASIGLSRDAEDMKNAVYISNILNWRPPGNRTPTQAEMDISLPFIERHIALVQPKMIILCGGVAAKSLLRRSESISRLRGRFHEYEVPEALQCEESSVIPAIATYHPAYLLRTPVQKKAVWQDMLMLQEKLKEIFT